MKVYGSVGFLAAVLNPLLVMVMSGLGAKPIPSETRVLEQAERDAQLMVNDGYRVVGSEWYEIPWLGAGFQKVTYELSAPHRPASTTPSPSR